jgi:hypothetical protein
MALFLGRNDAACDSFHRICVGYRRAAVFLDDETHGRIVTEGKVITKLISKYETNTVSLLEI